MFSGSLRDIGQEPKSVLALATAAETRAALLTETNIAKELGIFGSPTFVIGRELFWGDDRLDDAISWFRHGRVLAGDADTSTPWDIVSGWYSSQARFNDEQYGLQSGRTKVRFVTPFAIPSAAAGLCPCRSSAQFAHSQERLITGHDTGTDKRTQNKFTYPLM
jgi:hypothetical protein